MNTPQASPDLASLRVQIDTIDQQLLSLLNQRALVAEQVGEVKKREGTPFFRRACGSHLARNHVGLPGA